MFIKGAFIAALTTLAAAQAPNGTSICDYYTGAALKNNTAANQMTLLTVLVNTAVIGSYSPLANASIKVPGILNPNGTYMGTAVNLVPYFSGALNSTNGGGTTGVKKNFLDGGGAAPLMMNLPAFANATSSNQYTLLTHLYEFFGLLLGCTEVGMTGFPAYNGQQSMYEVHKFMVLDPAEMGYFITQVALAAQSFGVAATDIAKVGTALGTLFDVRCAPPSSALFNQTQSICTDPTCPLAPSSNCTAQPTIAAPAGAAPAGNATASGAPGASGSAKASGASGSAAAPSASAKSDAGRIAAAFGAVLAGAIGIAVIA